MIYHLISVALGYLLDLIIGDPYCLPHPVRAIGLFISFLEKTMIGTKDNPKELSGKKKRIYGILTVLIVVVTTATICLSLLVLGYKVNKIFGCALETIMIYQILATKCLKTESMKVYRKLEKGTLIEARQAVSMIVGRDTDSLDEAAIMRATVETVAENTSDGVIAPLMYAIIGGPVLGFVYKAINTCDSMIGYKNDRYLDYGRFAAKTDDVINYIPARLSAYLMMISCLFLGKQYHLKNAYHIYKRDRYNHASPNSAQTESVCAGALGIRLAGDSSYFGKIVKKPYIGDDNRAIELKDIKRANHLLYATSIICELIGLIILGALYLLCNMN